MNAQDILMYGNRTVLMTLTDVPEVEWNTKGSVWGLVCERDSRSLGVI